MISLKGKISENKKGVKQELINKFNSEMQLTTEESSKLYYIINSMEDSQAEQYLTEASRYGIKTVYMEIRNP